MSLVYSRGGSGLQQQLLGQLLGLLQGAPAAAGAGGTTVAGAAGVKLAADTKVFEEGQLGSTPGDGFGADANSAAFSRSQTYHSCVHLSIADQHPACHCVQGDILLAAIYTTGQPLAMQEPQSTAQFIPAAKYNKPGTGTRISCCTLLCLASAAPWAQTAGSYKSIKLYCSL